MPVSSFVATTGSNLCVNSLKRLLELLSLIACLCLRLARISTVFANCIMDIFVEAKA